MANIHRMTEKFMVAAGQVVRDTPSTPTDEEMQLRLNLEFEELKEKAQAMGKEGYFMRKVIFGYLRECIANANISNVIRKIYVSSLQSMLQRKGVLPVDTGFVNLPAVFDASRDQNVVWAGTDLCFGMAGIAGDGDKEVYRSNMSKFDDNEDDAALTLAKYANEGVEVYQQRVGNLIVTKRAKDDKVLKSHKYSEADLAPIVRSSMELKEPKQASKRSQKNALSEGLV